AELKDGKISSYTITPEQFELSTSDISQLKVETAEESLAMIRGVLNNQAGPARDIVVLNAGAAIYAADLVPNLEAGIKRAADVIAEGSAATKLDELIKLSQSFA
ncbi:MAG: anthranilate phosphoribosyltransferase, partial [Thiohalophilus sp.]